MTPTVLLIRLGSGAVRAPKSHQPAAAASSEHEEIGKVAP